MSEQDPDQPAEEFHRDRREHGGIPGHLDDDQLARLTEEERVEAGLDDYDPDEVPPATDAPPEPSVTIMNSMPTSPAGSSRRNPPARAGSGRRPAYQGWAGSQDDSRSSLLGLIVVSCRMAMS